MANSILVEFFIKVPLKFQDQLLRKSCELENVRKEMEEENKLRNAELSELEEGNTKLRFVVSH